jgi:hypothetical protein
LGDFEILRKMCFLKWGKREKFSRVFFFFFNQRIKK